MGAARAWALARLGRADKRSPAKVDAELAADFAAMGVVVEIDQTEDEGDYEIMLANLDALNAWLACVTQWRVVVGMRFVWLGLDYTAVDVVLRRQRPADPDSVFRDLQLMEDEALAVFAEHAA